MTKLSSAGLVYLHFGRRLLNQLTQLKSDDSQLEVLYDKVRASGSGTPAGWRYVKLIVPE